MVDVKYLFHFYLNWNPNYSNCKIPKTYKGEIPSDRNAEATAHRILEYTTVVVNAESAS